MAVAVILNKALPTFEIYINICIYIHIYVYVYVYI